MRLASGGESDKSNVTVANIAERDALVGSLSSGTLVTVLDASSDPAVGSGSAIYVWDGSAFSLAGNGGTASGGATGSASGEVLLSEQSEIVDEGNVATCLQAVLFTYTDVAESGKVQWTSADENNLVWLYASGADLEGGTPQEGPVRLGKGETYVFENVPRGAIIKSLKGGYGAAGITHDVGGGIIRTAIFPIAPVGLSTPEAQIYAARNSTTGGRIYVTNGPLENTVSLFRAGVAVNGQENMPLGPWESITLSTDADADFHLVAEHPVMVGVRAYADAPAYWDHRLVLPPTTDGLVWRRSCYISTLDNGTTVTVVSADHALNTYPVSDGSPAYLGSNTADYGYHPNSAVRVKANGRVQAYTYLDQYGASATAMSPVKSLAQRVVIPLYVTNDLDAGYNSIAIASPYEGKARLYKWNQTTGQPELVSVRRNGVLTTDIEFYRRDSSGNPLGTPATPDDQLYPASASIASSVQGWEYEMTEDFPGGFLEADVPVHVAVNSRYNEYHTFRGTSGPSVSGVPTNGQELACFGITPPEIRTALRVDDNGFVRKLSIDSTGAPVWTIC